MADQDANRRSEAQEHELVGARLREARELLQLTQLQVAEVLGIPRTSLVAIETGQRKVTGLELRRFARLYRRPVAWLLGEEANAEEEAAALYRAAQGLTAEDRDQVLKFAEFLAGQSADRPNPSK